MNEVKNGKEKQDQMKKRRDGRRDERREEKREFIFNVILCN